MKYMKLLVIEFMIKSKFDFIIKYHFKMDTKTRKKLWNKTEKGLKCSFRSNLKKYKVNLNNFEKDYEIHSSITNCESCYCKLTRDRYTKRTTKTFDHNHTTGYYRNTICNRCNIYRGLVDKRYLLVINELKFIFNPPSIIKGIRIN